MIFENCSEVGHGGTGNRGHDVITITLCDHNKLFGDPQKDNPNFGQPPFSLRFGQFLEERRYKL